MLFIKKMEKSTKEEQISDTVGVLASFQEEIIVDALDNLHWKRVYGKILFQSKRTPQVNTRVLVRLISQVFPPHAHFVTPGRERTPGNKKNNEEEEKEEGGRGGKPSPFQ